MTNRLHTVLVVDDDPYVREAVAGIVALEGHPTVVAREGKEALSRTGGVRPWVVVADFQMAEMDGCDLVLALRERFPGLPAVVMTGHRSSRRRIEALPAEYLAKPFGLQELLQAIAAATTKAAA